MCYLDELSASIVNDCDNLAIAGIEADVVLIPFANFDKAGSTINATNRILLDDLLCQSGTSGFKLEGIKQLNGFDSEFVPVAESVDRWKHTFRGVIMTPSAENRLQASKLSKGTSYLVVINKKYKGANSEDAFIVLGWDAGLYITEMTESSKDNNGAILFTLSSQEDTLEYDMPRNLLETDYATTLIAFDAQFVQA